MDNNELKKMHGTIIKNPGKKERLVIGSFNAKFRGKDDNFVICEDLSVELDKNDWKNSIKFIQRVKNQLLRKSKISSSVN